MSARVPSKSKKNALAPSTGGKEGIYQR